MNLSYATSSTGVHPPSYSPAHDLGWDAELERLERQAELTFDAELGALLDHGLTRSGEIVDLGCGSGAFIRRLRSELPSATVIGMDVNERLLSMVEPPTLHLNGDPIPTAIADDVIVRFVAQHLSVPERQVLWATVATLLRPGGRVHVIDVNDRDAGSARPWIPAAAAVFAKIAAAQAARGGDRTVILKVPQELHRLGFTDIRESTAMVTNDDREIDEFCVHLGPQRHSGLLRQGFLNSFDMAVLQHSWNQLRSDSDAHVSIKTHIVHARKSH